MTDSLDFGAALCGLPEQLAQAHELAGKLPSAACVVTFVVEREPGSALVIDVAEERAVRMLARAGLVPELRHAVS